ncbi:MAG: DNA recombination protein RmuC [Xanthomonadaceae bacterium]|nr:DNA recombination protein RmuC [Xanthomonadaceae bacterium]
MPAWILYLTIAIEGIVAILLIGSRAATVARQATLERELTEDRSKTSELAALKGRFDSTDQAREKAEAQVTELQVQLRDAVAKLASTEALRGEADLQRASTIEERDRIRLNLERLQDERNTECVRANTAEGRLEEARIKHEELSQRISQVELDRDEANRERQRAKIELAERSAERDQALQLAQEAKLFVETAREKLSTTFAEAANKVFDDKAVALEQRIAQSGEMSKKGMEEVLKPFQEQVGKFRERVEALNTAQTKDTATLVGSIAELKTLNQHMADASNALAKALKGNAKIRGNWGETILETVLLASGLEEGTNFRRQQSTTDEDTGKRLQPDVVVQLPDGREVVIDSKVNLVSWAAAHETDDASEIEVALTRHAAALRTHMRELASKNYPKHVGHNALDISILFVPIEGALSAALAADPNLQIDAWKQGVAFASPNTLMALLKVVERLWTRDRLQKQIHTISDTAGRLVDSVINFLESFGTIGDKLEAARTAYVKANSQLHDSSTSVLQRTQRLVEAGAKGKKLIPEELQPTNGEAHPLLPDETTA